MKGLFQAEIGVLASLDVCMYFQVLQLRLLATLKEMVRKGDMTERRLARLTGVSQPHMHNVLKGVRILSSEVADEILRHLYAPLVTVRGQAGKPSGKGGD